MEKCEVAGLVHDYLQESRMDRDTRAKDGEWVTVSRKGKEKVGKSPNVVPKKANVAICSNLVGPKEKKDHPSTLGSLGTT
ncbi:hypothetical protein HN51_038889 [Arachis hypogaea]